MPQCRVVRTRATTEVPVDKVMKRRPPRRAMAAASDLIKSSNHLIMAESTPLKESQYGFARNALDVPPASMHRLPPSVPRRGCARIAPETTSDCRDDCRSHVVAQRSRRHPCVGVFSLRADDPPQLGRDAVEHVALLLHPLRSGIRETPEKPISGRSANSLTIRPDFAFSTALHSPTRGEGRGAAGTALYTGTTSRR
ncbi:hypothetical protein SAMN05216330_112155 [Bradyrhizobium sp. Ghvi]|nr:hypothetical protein SAMN05216330_112155 [Bradyrhizobium sp. Ghvi]